MNIRLLTTIPLGAAVVLAAVGCAPSQNDETSRADGDAIACPVDPLEGVTDTVRIGYQQIPNGDLVVKDAGLLETCLPDATIEWSVFNSGGDVIQAFGSDSIDIGLFGSSPATKAVSAPLDLPVQVIWIQDVIGAAESLAVKDPSITDIKGLVGKKIGVPFASTAHYSLLAALDRAGITGDVELIDLQPDAIRAAWTTGQIDAAWVWEPTLSELLDSGGTLLVSGEETAEQGAPTYDLSAASISFIEGHPEILEVWTAAQNWAVGQLLNEPDAAHERIAAQLGVPVDAVAAQTAGYVYLDASEQAGADHLGGGLGADLENTAEFLHSQGEIQAVAPSAHYKDSVYVAAARAVQQK